MSKLKNTVESVKNNLAQANINIPVIDNIDSDNATPNNLETILNALNTAKAEYTEEEALYAIGRAIDDIDSLPQL